jgi:hypothetical protein
MARNKSVLPLPGSAVDADALGGIDGEFDRTDMAGDAVAEDAG